MMMTLKQVPEPKNKSLNLKPLEVYFDPSQPESWKSR
jgi:hypothetical protein